MSQRLIWAVATGEYSDYRVQAIFERREDAEAAIAAGYLGEIEEFDLFAVGELPVKATMIRYYGWVSTSTGEVTREDGYQYDTWVHPSAKGKRAEVTTGLWPWPRHGLASRMELAVSGPATKRTHKAFTDALAKLRAECIEGLHGGVR